MKYEKRKIQVIVIMKGVQPVMRKNLKEARQKAGMTQQQMAEYLGVNERYYKSIESGERLGGIWIWDMLEDLFKINQRVLREIHPGKANSP